MKCVTICQKKTSVSDFAEIFNKEIERYVAESVENKNTDITLLIDDIIEEVPNAIDESDLAKAYEKRYCDADLVLPDYIDAKILSTTINYEGVISRDMMQDFEGIYNTFKFADYLYNKGDDSFTMTFTLIQYEDGRVEDFYTPGCYNALAKHEDMYLFR